MSEATDATRSSSGLAATCSRERSRAARTVLNEFFYPVADGARYALDLRCPFSHARDLFYEHEIHKEPVRHSKLYWRSLYSGKVFKSEYYVDKHMERRHGDKIPSTADVCLADYCDVLQCDKHAEYVKNGRGSKPTRCDEEQMSLVRDKCHEMLTQCFPNENGSTRDNAGKLNVYFTKYYCDQMTCADVDGVFELMSAHHDSPGVGYYIALAFLFFIVVTYYLTVYSWTNGRRVSSDIKRARVRARASWSDYLPRPVARRFNLERRKRKTY